MEKETDLRTVDNAWLAEHGRLGTAMQSAPYISAVNGEVLRRNSIKGRAGHLCYYPHQVDGISI